MKRSIPVAGIAAALVVAAPAPVDAQDTQPQQMIGTAIMCDQNGCVESAPARCLEDDPCWVWSRMGNHKRGATINGRRVVLGPCGFARAYRAHRLTDLLPLKGDWWAIHHGCRNAR